MITAHIAILLVTEKYNIQHNNNHYERDELIIQILGILLSTSLVIYYTGI